MDWNAAYRALLLFYPRRFRVRFAPEIEQVLRDCYRTTQGRHRLADLADLALSIPREWRREISRSDSEVDYTGLADSFSITAVVGTLLLAWGWTAANIALGGPEGIVGAVIATFVAAIIIGILCAAVVARKSRIEAPRIRI